MYLTSYIKSEAAYLLTKISSQIQNVFHWDVLYHFMRKDITTNWILHITGANFQRQMSAYEFQVFITIGINSMSLVSVLWHNLNKYAKLNK